MTTIKLKFKHSTNTVEKGTIYYSINHEGANKYICSGYNINDEEWNNLHSKITIPNIITCRGVELSIIRDRIKFNIKRLKHISRYLESKSKDYNLDDILKIFEFNYKGITLFDFLLDTAQKLKEMKKYRTSETYVSLLNSFMSYRNGEDLLVANLDINIVERYEAYLKQHNAALNTISFYMRTLRATYNRAVDIGIVSKNNLFKKVYTNIEKTPKRAIPISCITKLKNLDLSHLPEIEFARDVFLFSFYTRGMSFIDIAYLSKSNIRNGEIIYRRQKTGQRLNIKWEKCMSEIVKKHPNKNNDYLLPIILNSNLDSRKQYIDSLSKVNKNLKKVALLAGISINITSYVARHSWASAAKFKRIPISVISEAMGHDNEVTTQIYLSSLDTDVINKANKMIIKSL